MTKDLDDAISTATYQVRLSRFVRWCSFPIAILIMFSLWNKVQPVKLVVAAVLFFVAVLLGSQWEHNWYVKRLKRLQSLKTKLSDP
jgi:hypothetical protein